MMMARKRNEISKGAVVEHCFLCLKRLTAKDKMRQEGGAPASAHSPTPTQSIHHLSHYLHLEALENARKIELKVDLELCQECAELSQTFSEQYRRLEKLRMEMEFSLTRIHGKLAEAEEAGREGLLLPKMTDREKADWMIKFKVGEVVRKEAMDKCLQKLTTTATPRIKIPKMRMRITKSHPPRVKLEELELETGVPSIPPQSCTDLDDPPRLRRPIAKLPTKWKIKKPATLKKGIKKKVRPVKKNNQHVTLTATPKSNAAFEAAESQTGIVKIEHLHMNDDEVTPTRIPDKVGVKRGRTLTKTTPQIRKRVAGQERDIRLNPQTGQLICDLCGKEYRTLKHLGRHYGRVHTAGKFPCHACGLQFTQTDSRKRHYESMHLKTQQFECHHCGKFYYRKDIFQKHLVDMHSKN